MTDVRCCSATPGVLAIWLIGAAAGAAFSAGDGPPRCEQARRGETRPTPPPVTTLRTRDAEVAIYAIAGELRYSVIEHSGRLALHLGTERDFVVHFPGLAEHVEAAFAEDATWVDASVTRPSPRGETAAARP